MSSIYADQGTAAHWVLEQCLSMIYDMGIPVTASNWIGADVEVTDGPHARRSPSSAKRWMHCTASVALNEKHPEPAQGPRLVRFEAEDAAAVQVCLDYVAERVADMGAFGTVKVLPERRVSLKYILGTDEHDGTSDITIIASTSEGIFSIEHIDYKHGAGVPVDVDDPQNDLYMLGTLAGMYRDGVLPEDDLDALNNINLALTIIQPRCDKIEPRIRSRVIDDASVWWGEISHKINQANATTDHFEAGDWCRFCAVGGDARGDVCETYVRHQLAAVGIVDEEEPLPQHGHTLAAAAQQVVANDLGVLSPQQIVAILDVREALAGMLNAVETHAVDLLKGDNAPLELAARYKVVPGRTQRRWAEQDEEALFAELKKIKIHDAEKGKDRALGKKDVMVEKIKSPAQLETVLTLGGVDKESTRWAAFQRLIIKPEGRPTLAPIEDPRQPVANPRVDATQAFAHVKPQE